LKRTFLFSILAVFSAALMPLSAASQVNPEAAPSSEQGAPFKYEVYGGFAYTSLNQVNGSRYGLIGGKVSLTRDWGKYFGLMGAIDYYKPPLKSGSPGNPGDPSVYTFMVAPGIHADIFWKLSGLIFGEVGVEHTGGENMSPSTSFAGGFGGGINYNLTRRLAVRAMGDRVAGSFSLINNTPQLAYSSHRTWNARATIGVVYRF